MNLTFLSPIQSDSQVCAQFIDQKKEKGMIKRKWLIIPLWCLEVYPLGKKQGRVMEWRRPFFPRLTKASLSVGGWNFRRRLWKQRSVFLERGAESPVFLERALKSQKGNAVPWTWEAGHLGSLHMHASLKNRKDGYTEGQTRSHGKSHSHGRDHAWEANGQHLPRVLWRMPSPINDTLVRRISRMPQRMWSCPT